MIGKGVVMRTAIQRCLIVLSLSLVVSAALIEEMARPEGQGGIPPEVVAEYVYAIVQADRTLYTTHVVERMQELGVIAATEQWKKQGTLPLPAQMLLMTGEEVQGQGTKLRIRLTSLWPINKANGPADEFERLGLERVAKEPQKPYAGIVSQGDRRMFKAIFADRAITKACVECHNGHALSNKRDLALNDVMGAIVISFPSR
jgi:Protein of unknown function (DUF3365)